MRSYAKGKWISMHFEGVRNVKCNRVDLLGGIISKVIIE